MDWYLLFIVILFALAISDLIVGVANDAVNFLNSAIGAKAGSFNAIMAIAALGVIVGALFSNGMMEVARNGVFYPGQFKFEELIYVFLAVMLTDVILLDAFNTFGMPTSTTVSLVFELLGSGVAIAAIKIMNDPNALSMAGYINGNKALGIISGILLSVVVAFIAGAIFQYLFRIAFSFDYSKRVKYLGAIFGGIAITSITYFMLIKGVKGSAFATYEMPDGSQLKDWIKDNSNLIIIYSLIGWTIISQLLNMVFKVDILKLVVFVGTFALAMAFAGNDLVNFIGVPLAGYESFNIYLASGSDSSIFMSSLDESVETPLGFLAVSGVIMVLTLYLSSKAKRVTKTSVNLSSQYEGEEQFSSSTVAKALVEQVVKVSAILKSLLPNQALKWIDKQFDQKAYKKRMKALGKDAPAFDMLRAAVNLVISSILISYATSHKLPLSTTYVTFMVAMGTSLTDRAWGTESAVFRITGVLVVVLGWFFTALIAFTVSFIIAFFIFHTGVIGVLVVVALAIFLAIKSHIFTKKDDKEKDVIAEKQVTLLNLGVVETCKIEIISSLKNYDQAIKNSMNGLFVYDKKQLKKTAKEVEKLNKEAKKLKKTMHSTVAEIKEESVEAGHYYIQVLDYLREMAHSLEYVSIPALEYVENSHKPLTHDQIDELRTLKELVTDLIESIISIIETRNYESVNETIAKLDGVLSKIGSNRKSQVKRIKNEQASTRGSVLYFSLIHELKNFSLHSINLLKSHRDFITKS